MRALALSVCCLFVLCLGVGCGPTNGPAPDDSADVTTGDTTPGPGDDAAEEDDAADALLPEDDGLPADDGGVEPVEKTPPPEPEATLDETVKKLAEKDQQSEASDELVAKGEAAVPLLLEALKSQNPHVRSGAIFTLSRLGAKASGATAALKELQASEEDEVIRDSISFALDAINGE